GRDPTASETTLGSPRGAKRLSWCQPELADQFASSRDNMGPNERTALCRPRPCDIRRRGTEPNGRGAYPRAPPYRACATDPACCTSVVSQERRTGGTAGLRRSELCGTPAARRAAAARCRSARPGASDV